MCRVPGAVAGAVWAVLTMTATAGPSQAAPAVQVEPSLVSIVTTPGGRVAVLGVMRTIHGTIPGFDRWEGIVEDADGDGRVEIELERESTPEWSQWFAVDLASGELAAAGRSELAEPSRPLAADSELAAGEAVWPVSEGIVEVLVVRPGEGERSGAWAGEVWDGGSADGDGLADGRAGVSPARLEPVGESGRPPERYEAGDVLIAVTPRALRWGIASVVEGAQEVSR